MRKKRTILGRVQPSSPSKPSLAEMNWNATCEPKSYLPTSVLNCANASMVKGIKVSGAQISNSLGCLSHEDLVDECVTKEKVKIIKA